mmetsp:Transcript_27608/g.38366  ORF Transcript_27608/g.38366 Transcript_27608/m.38366 type:complete len:190 (+) Transcript_27608:1-570(+)
MKFYKKKDFSHVNFAKHGIDSSVIFDEIPMKVQNSHLIHAFLYELQDSEQLQETFSCEFDRLDLGSDTLFETNLNFIGDCIDNLLTDHSKFSYSQRSVSRIKAQMAAQKSKLEARIASGEKVSQEEINKLKNDLAKKNLPYTPRLDAYLLSHKISYYSKKLRSVIGESMAKMFEVDALSRELDSGRSTS